MSYVALPPGVIFPYAGASTPAGFLPCDGSAVSRTTYAALYAVLGTKHGQGDGSTTFNLPDTRGVVLRGLINIPAVTGTGTASSNNATFNSHGLRTGMRVRMTSGTLSGLVTTTTTTTNYANGSNQVTLTSPQYYYAIVIDSNTLAFATTQANAIAASPTKVAITGANSAVIQQWMDPDSTTRVSPQLGANSGSNVGSIQEDQVGTHNHTFTALTMAGSGGIGYGQVAWSGSNTPYTPVKSGNTDTFMTSENRMINLYINHIIKF